ncbi:MAG: redoxin domain-containing protein [Pseudomonadales bacterium]
MFRSARLSCGLGLLGLLATGFAGTGLALAPNDPVENFRLLDHQGQSHELYYYSDAKAIVVMVQGNGCPIVRNAMPRFKQLRDEFEPQGVRFFLLNTNLQDNRKTVAAEAENFSYDIPILIDDSQLIGETLGLVRTGEVFVVDPKQWRVSYQGALDDRLTYEKQKGQAQNHYLRDAVVQSLAGEPITTAQTDAVGCLINFPEQTARAQHANISYEKTIAPLLIDNCVSCHRQGGIGPWAMTDYKMVRGFSLMMREVVRTQRMPPWHADPAHGKFSNTRALSPEQRATLVHWIEAGAPRGEGEDPLLSFEHRWPTWALGEPDLVIDIPPSEVPATGVVDYRYIRISNPLKEDAWVRASEILPGERGVLHHVITRFGELQTEGPRKGRLRREGGGSLAGYVPGMVVRELPENTGTLLPAGSTIEFQMHYTTNGKPATDHSKLGIYLHKSPPKHEISSVVLMNWRIQIPPHAKAHKESAQQVLKQDAMLYSLLPHAHYRGKASEFRAIYPDGSEELLLSVPNYDFNWQTTYVLSVPKRLPAGTTIVHNTWWDNSAQNPANPDPNRTVPWGQQSWDEMLFGVATLRYLDPDEAASPNIASGR